MTNKERIEELERENRKLKEDNKDYETQFNYYLSLIKEKPETAQAIEELIRPYVAQLKEKTARIDMLERKNAFADKEIERLKEAHSYISDLHNNLYNEYQKKVDELKTIQSIQNQEDEEIKKLKQEIERLKQEPRINITKYNRHGCKHTRLYQIWCGMKNRCYSLNNPSYKYYGARGITICDDWRNDFSTFKEWAETNGYEENLTIDRIDNNGNYEPSNCRWITMGEQVTHQRNTKMIDIDNENLSLRELAEKYHINKNTLYYRIIRNAWSMEKALQPKMRGV